MSSHTPRHLLTAALVTITLGAAACGSGDDDAAPEILAVTTTEATTTTEAAVDEPADEADATTTTAAPVTTVDDVAATPSTTASTTTTAPDDVTSDTVPGEPLDFGPELGRPLIIIGVETDDVLNFRVAPSPSADIAVSYPLTLTEFDMFALGEAWSAPSGVWWKVNVMGQEAWANQKFLGVRGGSAPIFDDVAQVLQILMFESVEQGGLAAAETRASTEPASRIVQIAEPVITPLGDAGAVGSVWFDVLDLGDHIQKGERLLVEFDVVFDEETPELDDIAFVVLKGVEMTFIQAM